MAVIKNTREMTCSASSLTKKVLAEFLEGMDEAAHISVAFMKGRGQRGEEVHLLFTTNL